MERIRLPRLSLSFPLLLLGILALPIALESPAETAFEPAQPVSVALPSTDAPAPGEEQEGSHENSSPTQLSGLDTARVLLPRGIERIESGSSCAIEPESSSSRDSGPTLLRLTDSRLALPVFSGWKKQPVRGPPAA